MKRHQGLQEISKEHRVILSFCLDLKKGIKNDVSAQKINAYIKWFWEAFLEAHILFEEKRIYSLSTIHETFKTQALKEHSTLKSIVLQNQIKIDEAGQFADILEKHIRFEERHVFKDLQKYTSEEILLKLKDNHSRINFCIVPGAFWK